MTDLRKDFTPPDPGRVNLETDLEVRYWCRHFMVSPDTLRETVDRVGGSASEIIRELNRSH